MASGIILAPTAAEKNYVIPKTIYHYTSPEGIIGIFNNNELWFSRFDCLNDINEGKYIINPYRKAIEELRGIIDESFLKEIAELEPDFKHYFRKGPIQNNGDTTSYYIENIESIPYLCCFSINKDSLPM
jgi:hypothetical protein